MHGAFGLALYLVDPTTIFFCIGIGSHNVPEDYSVHFTNHKKSLLKNWTVEFIKFVKYSKTTYFVWKRKHFDALNF